MTAVATSPAPRVAVRKLLWVAPLAGLVAALANLVVTLAGQALAGPLVLPLQPGTEPQPLPLIMVVLASFVPALAAAGVLAALGRFTARPVFVFNIVAVVFLLVSFGGPASLPVAFSIQAVLGVMHLVAGVVIIGALNTLGRER